MKKFVFAFIALMGLSPQAFAGGGDDRHDDDRHGCKDSHGPTCLFAEGFESISSLPGGGWAQTNDNVQIRDTAHDGDNSLRLYDDSSIANPDAVATFLGGLSGTFSNLSLTFYWKEYNSESTDALTLSLLSNGSVLTPSVSFTAGSGGDGWNKETMNFGTQTFNPFGLQLALNISSTSNEGFYVDDFCLTGDPVLTPIPEPEIYAMLAAGLGLMGWVARRRKQQLGAV